MEHPGQCKLQNKRDDTSPDAYSLQAWRTLCDNKNCATLSLLRPREIWAVHCDGGAKSSLRLSGLVIDSLGRWIRVDSCLLRVDSDRGYLRDVDDSAARVAAWTAADQSIRVCWNGANIIRWTAPTRLPNTATAQGSGRWTPISRVLC